MTCPYGAIVLEYAMWDGNRSLCIPTRIEKEILILSRNERRYPLERGSNEVVTLLLVLAILQKNQMSDGDH